MAAASLVVRISADLNDFSKNLTKMTREVSKAADKLTDVGKSLTIGITAPVGLAIAALSKMAVENEAVAARLDRAFGPAAARVNEHLQRLMQLVPETNTDLQKMAITVHDFATGLGMAGPKAELLTEGLTTLAAQLSAAKGISMDESLQALQGGMSGATRGLKQYGIVIDQAQVKQEAYRLGLLHTNRELTPLGTALATYSLLVKQTSQFQGEAAAVHANAGRQLQFLKRDLAELADSTSNLLIPALRTFAGWGKAVVDVLTAIPMPIRGALLGIVAMAAVIGPTIIVVAKLTEAISTLRAALTLLGEGSALKSFIGVLADPRKLLILLGVAAALGAIYAIWKHFHKDGPEKALDLPKIPSIEDILKGLNAGTDMTTGSALQQFQKHATELGSAFDRALTVGDNIAPMFADIQAQMHEAGTILGDINRGPLDEWKLAAAEIYDRWNRIVLTMKAANAMGTPDAAKVVQRASRALVSDQQIQFNIAGQRIQDETQLREREAALKLADIFDATRVAGIELQESFRDTAHQISIGWAKLKTLFTDPAAIGTSVTQALSGAAQQFAQGFTPAALALKFFGDVVQSIETPLKAFLYPLTTLAGVIGQALVPVMRLLFPVVRAVAVALALFGEISARVTAGVARALGGLISAIGKLIAKIPGLGGVGRSIRNFGDSILAFADGQKKTADQLAATRKQLQGMSFDDATKAVADLAGAAGAAAAALLNVPFGWKVALERFRATTPVGVVNQGGSDGSRTTPRSGGPNGAGGTSAGTATGRYSETPVILKIDGKTVAKSVIRWAQAQSVAQFGTPTRWSEVLV